MIYLAIVAMIDDRVGLSTVVASEHIGEAAGDASGDSVHLENVTEKREARGTRILADVNDGVELVFFEHGRDRVLAAVMQPQTLQQREPFLLVHFVVTHHLFVRFFQV